VVSKATTTPSSKECPDTKSRRNADRQQRGKVGPFDSSREFFRDWMPGSKASDYVVSANIETIK